MPTKPITERQRYWLDHLNTAVTSGSSLVAYAAAHQLKPKDLYAWKTRLIDLEHLPASRKGKKRGFVSVVPARNAATASLVMPNGFRLELQGAIDRALLRDLINAVREAS